MKLRLSRPTLFWRTPAVVTDGVGQRHPTQNGYLLTGRYRPVADLRSSTSKPTLGAAKETVTLALTRNNLMHNTTGADQRDSRVAGAGAGAPAEVDYPVAWLDYGL